MSAAVVPVILDVDTGVDDACALLLAAAHPGLKLLAVTCVAGNVELDQVVRNTVTVLTAAGAGDVPVGRGAERPLLEPARPARHVHGTDGLGDIGWPVPPAVDAPRPPAVQLLRDVLLDAAATAEPVTLVTLGPLTNVALLLRTYPEAAAGLERLVFMGGSAGPGNTTAAAEFNVWHDPEAAAVVLAVCAELQLPTTMYGLDVFYDPCVDPADVRALCAAPQGSAARLAGELVAFQARRRGDAGAAIGDAGAVCAVVDPGGLTTRRMAVRVELAGTWTRGRTVVDARPGRPHAEHVPGADGALVDVATAVDGDRYARLWVETVGGRAAGPA